MSAPYKPAFYHIRSQTHILNPSHQVSSLKNMQILLFHEKPGQHPEPQRAPGKITCQVHHQNFSSQFGQQSSGEPEAIQAFRSSVPNLSRSLFSTTDHSSFKTKEETEAKEENTHPTKTNPEIDTYTYNHSKSRYLNISVGTQSTTTRVIWHHKNLLVLLQKTLNIQIQLKYEKIVLKQTLLRW